jgi:hypothetical protein
MLATQVRPEMSVARGCAIRAPGQSTVQKRGEKGQSASDSTGVSGERRPETRVEASGGYPR